MLLHDSSVLTMPTLIIDWKALPRGLTWMKSWTVGHGILGGTLQGHASKEEIAKCGTKHHVYVWSRNVLGPFNKEFHMK